LSFDTPLIVCRCENMARDVMLERLLAFGPSEFSLVAEAIEHLGKSFLPQLDHFLHLIPSACIEQTVVETCVANSFTVRSHYHHPHCSDVTQSHGLQISVLHYAINLDAPIAPRSPAKGRLSFARVYCHTSRSFCALGRRIFLLALVCDCGCCAG
jgi:hypothetical protein